MSLTFEPRSTWAGRWPSHVEPNTNAAEAEVGDAIVPDITAAKVLLDRLVRRSTVESALDRDALRHLNRDAWGVE